MVYKNEEKVEVGFVTRNTSMEKPQIRYLHEMKPVLYDRAWAETVEDFEVYRFWRGESPERKWQRPEIKGLRYDITIIWPKMLGKEFAKTKGHCHKTKELIKVLEGEAFYFFQKGNENEIEDVYVVKAKAGNFVLVSPEFYDHLTINPSLEKRMVMANWINPECENDYSLFEKTRGACYYYTTEGWIKNKNYKVVPPLRFIEPLKKMPKDFKSSS